MTFAEQKIEWKEVGGVVPCAITVWNLSKSDLSARSPLKEPFITSEMRNNSLDWSKDHVKWIPEQWKFVFSPSKRSSTCMALMETKKLIAKKWVVSSRVCGLLNCIYHRVWPCIPYQGVGRLNFIQRTLNAEGYLAMM